MGMVVMTYKVNPNSELEDVDTDAIAEAIAALRDDNYDIQAVETKPLAFGLKFVQVHVKMNDGEGLADAFEGMMSDIHGVGEIEVLSMGLIRSKHCHAATKRTRSHVGERAFHEFTKKHGCVTS